ncbi:unnamed protein product [Owenia fusiformis]|uniref:Carbohydrate sulfotransferase n=1 Tax=Owenia fusiformis TaxID=6347 RepID=A0A8J1UTC2_OWEFU|nr:unnamed protein product [Owenia fusiformis]
MTRWKFQNGKHRKENEHQESKSTVLTQVESMLYKRHQSMKQQCNKTKPETHPKLDFILVSEKLKMVYCMVPKVASSSWLTVLLTLHMEHPPKDKEVFEIWNKNVKPPHLTDYSKQDQKRILSEYFKFMFIRDPLDRLISAWDDKFNHVKLYFSKRYGRDMIKKYRENPSGEALRTGNKVKLEEMISYVRDIAEIKYADEHWRPMTDLCDPCAIDYDMYGNFYNIEEESKFVFKNINTNISNMPFTNAGIHRKGMKRTSHDYYKTVERNKLIEYYSNISIKKVVKLQNQYKQDYELFSDAFQFKKLVED